jgi:2-oxoglutarate dehydrogenase E2 component (dihydrolipoamide succinyltransferase)
MPALGESVTEGTVTRWLKAVGETVEADEPLLEVSTDKVDTEIPSPASGTLLEIKVPEDETAAVGAELAVIGAAGGAQQAQQQEAAAQQEAPAQQEAAAQQAAPAQQAASAAQPAAREQAAPAKEPQPAAASRAATPAAAETGGAGGNGTGSQSTAAQAVEDFGGYVTPLVRRLAGEQGVDLSALSGTGVGGRIRKQDVLDAAERQRAAAKAAQQAPAAPAKAASQSAAKPQPSPLRGRTEKLTRIRKITAQRLVESLQISAQLTTVVEVDVTRIARLRQQAKAQFQQMHGVKLSFLPFFALAAVEALRVHPNVNASIDMEAGTVTYHDGEHLGIAVDTEKGLMVPVIHNAGDLNLAGLAKRITDLAERTRTMKIEPDELSGGTFTLTNTGSRGALFDTPIINQPQVGILGTGSVVKRAVVLDDPELGEVVVPRSMVYLALSYDHRQVDGADAARFLTTIKERLEAGNFESELGLA